MRRQLNQGFFIKLFLAGDGSVAWAELTEPFASLIEHELRTSDYQAMTGDAQNAPEWLSAVRATGT